MHIEHVEFEDEGVPQLFSFPHTVHTYSILYIYILPCPRPFNCMVCQVADMGQWVLVNYKS